jgi:uncharacterized protein
MCLTNVGAKKEVKKMKELQKIAKILVIIGALNWGLMGLFDLNVITAIFSNMAGFEKIIYALIGISGVSVMLSKGKK